MRLPILLSCWGSFTFVLLRQLKAINILRLLYITAFCCSTYSVYCSQNYCLASAANKQALFGRCGLDEKLANGRFQQSPEKGPHTIQNGSTVHCFGQDKKDRSCRFQNLCYSSKSGKYLFFHGPETFQKGLPKRRFDPDLLDLASVDDHNTKYFNYVDFPASSIGVDFHDIEYIRTPSVLFHRFNPENLMHVIHDDLLPLWMTLRLFFAQSIPSETQLVMMDGRAKGPWIDLYHMISSNIYLKEDAQKHELVCFKEVLVGLSKDTTWYQYGFKVPQGPILNKIVSPIHLKLFAEELRTKITCSKRKKEHVVLISRKHTRCILNEWEVSIALANHFTREVVFLDFDQHSFADAICMIGNAVAVVGMHGAEIILSLFLQTGSVVIELFPYGVEPGNYTPYKRLAEIIGLQYFAWKNTNLEHTKAYPDRLPEQGGISHLPKIMQDSILSSAKIPEHLCCNNPFWLYRIYQDTLVDVQSLQDVLFRVELQEEQSDHLNKILLYPDAVQQPQCTITKNQQGIWELRATWQPPINEEHIKKNDFRYQLILQKNDENDISAYELTDTELMFKNIEYSRGYKLWVRCILGHILGPLSTTVHCVES